VGYPTHTDDAAYRRWIATHGLAGSALLPASTACGAQLGLHRPRARA